MGFHVREFVDLRMVGRGEGRDMLLILHGGPMVLLGIITVRILVREEGLLAGLLSQKMTLATVMLLIRRVSLMDHAADGEEDIHLDHLGHGADNEGNVDHPMDLLDPLEYTDHPGVGMAINQTIKPPLADHPATTHPLEPTPQTHL